MIQRSLVLATLAAAVLLAACSEGASSGLDSRYAVERPVRVVLIVNETDINIATSIEGVVLVTGTFDSDRYEHNVTFDGAVVRVHVQRKRSLLSLVRTGGAEVRVRVPAGTEFEVVATDSNITVEAGPIGGGLIETTNGAVTVQGGDGDLSVRNKNGSVTVSDQRGALDIETSAAMVSVVDHVGAPVKILTDNASIDFHGEIGEGGESEMTTTNGSIILNLAGQPSIALDAVAENGSVRSQFAILDGERGPAAISGRIAGGVSMLRLRTTNGLIDVKSAELQ